MIINQKVMLFIGFILFIWYVWTIYDIVKSRNSRVTKALFIMSLFVLPVISLFFWLYVRK